MPHRARPMTGMLVFLGINLVLVNTISPVYDFVCFHPYWERRRERRQKEREALQMRGSLGEKSTQVKAMIMLTMLGYMTLMQRCLGWCNLERS
ncbi:hypothetical protein EJB05_19303 [Eragrostis curvula]|uniref:Uncharacterized protein n=1 Tax=Eragrostis curvula TaxID=38414 RepID=A0A5J9UVD0_9POAL|nr:hypothetical protein EJB05_19303 [Eragrostis curvula]